MYFLLENRAGGSSYGIKANARYINKDIKQSDSAGNACEIDKCNANLKLVGSEVP